MIHVSDVISAPRSLALPSLPDALLLEGLGDFGGHVVLVVLGEHGVGKEAAGGIELAFGHHALALAEEIGKDAGVADGNGLGGVGDGERHGQSLAALQAAVGDEAAEADALAGRDLLFRHLLGRVKEHDGVAQRKQHEEYGNAEDADGEADERRAALLAGHEPSPRVVATLESSASAPASPSKLRRASASAARASSLRSSTA